jgi:hypothetical protein
MTILALALIESYREDSDYWKDLVEDNSEIKLKEKGFGKTLFLPY